MPQKSAGYGQNNRIVTPKFSIINLMAHILVLHGPNLNLLGGREPSIYGKDTLDQINQRLIKLAQQHGHTVDHYQNNAEHKLIEKIQKATDADFIIINPAALTHTSIALRDALLAIQIPFIEVHLSNIYKREPFRQRSYISDCAVGIISGFGAIGYELGLQAAFHQLKLKEHNGHS